MPETEYRKKQKAQYKKENYWFFKSIGICVQCTKEKAFNGGVYCAECAWKRNEQKRARGISDKERESARVRHKKRYDEHKEIGLCVNCNRKATPGYVYCADCRMVARRSNQEWAVKSGRKKGYAERGLCIRCGADPVEGKKLCETCLEKARESMAHARQYAPCGEFWNRA